MSQHHSDPVEENIETHPVKLAIAVIVGAVGLVVGIVLLAYFAVGSHRVGETESKANTLEAITQRIAPLTRLAVEGSKTPTPALTPAVVSKAANAPVVAMAIPVSLPAKNSGAGVASGGESVYKTTCSVCHAAGIAGAPKTGEKGSWAARIAKGKALLYEHALKGLNGMPAKGGNAALADNDVKAAVDFMVAQVK